MKNNGTKISFYATFALFIVILSFRPAYNWDMIAYMACSIGMEESDFEKVHNETYTLLKNQVPESVFVELTAGDYRETMLNSSDAFKEQIPYYSIRILYISIITVLYKLGMSMTLATVVPSLLSILLLMVIIFEIADKTIGNTLIAGTLTLILMGFPPILKLARQSTPDALSILVLTAIAILYITNKNRSLIFPLMAIAILTRTDTIIWCALLLGIDAIVYRKSIPKRWLSNLFQFTLLVGLLFSLNQVFHNGGWKVVFYNSFIQRMNFPLSDTPEFSLGEYFGVLLSSSWYFFSYFLILCLGLFLMWNKNVLSLLSNKGIIIVGVCILTTISKFILFPAVNGRFYFGLLIVAVAAILLEKDAFSQLIGRVTIKRRV